MLGRRPLETVLLVVFALAGCTPLAGRTLDPAGAIAGPEQGPPPERDQWVGRYEDSRGTGELVMQIRRAASRIAGVWKLRTGGDGILSGAVVGNTSVVKFELATQGGPCFVLIEGAGEIREREWTATYGGRDCQGPITNGRFTLKKQ